MMTSFLGGVIKLRMVEDMGEGGVIKFRMVEDMGEGGVKKSGKSGDGLYVQHFRFFQVLVDGK
jgi:hypothetical protein